jgi:hypothetical protein
LIQKRIAVSFVLAFMSASVPGYSQGLKKIFSRKDKVDSNYVKPYANELTVRTFLSKKYTSIKIPGSIKYPSFSYQPNTTLNFGIGATYRSFSLNLAYGIPLLNGDDATKGKTKYLDLQGHFYSRKFAFDFFGQFYKGYYLSTENFIPGYSRYYIRPDIRARLVGFSTYYVFNNERFSYRASMLQTERQTKSAGTFVLGGGIYYGSIASDSTLVPHEIADQYPQGDVGRLRFIKIGPGIGYAYTFVYKEHWFATASVTLNPTLDLIRENTALADKDRTDISMNYTSRVALGYNSRRWIYTASWVNNTLNMQGTFNDGQYRMSTGNYRLTVARRLTLNRKAKKALKPADAIINAPKKILQ